jgi:hypothetical protein
MKVFQHSKVQITHFKRLFSKMYNEILLYKRTFADIKLYLRLFSNVQLHFNI